MNNPSRLGPRGGGGEIVEVQGGHIVRSTGRKDRHSKVCTSKGPRDRRVRLAAHTAIQFYDVQDRLGYDRPSKAVDWLINKAKTAIDQLAQLPAWHPTTTTTLHQQNTRKQEQAQDGDDNDNDDQEEEENQQMSSFLPPSIDSDVIADTIKSFFPMGASGEANSFHSFANGQDLISSRNNHNSNSSNQDLRLSLQSFQDPIFQHHHTNPTTQHSQPRLNHQHQQQQLLLSSGASLPFDTWQPEHHLPAQELSRYMFASPALPQPAQQQVMFNQQQFFSFSQQRGPLQSSNKPSLRAWMMDPPPSSSSSIPMAEQHQGVHLPIYPSLSSSLPSATAIGYGGFSGFHIPARIQGDEEEHDGYSDKPSSASSDSRH